MSKTIPENARVRELLPTLNFSKSASTAGPKFSKGFQARAMSVQPKSLTSASTMASREPQRGVCSQRPM